MKMKNEDGGEARCRSLLESYKRHMAVLRRPLTVQSYVETAERYLASIGWSLRKISLPTASEFVSATFNDDDGIQKAVSSSTRNRRVSALHSFAEWLFGTMRLLKDNPLAGLKRGRTAERLPQFLTDDEMKKLLESQDTSSRDGLRDRALLEFLYCTGCRVSEAACLEWDMIDMKSAAVRVVGKGDKERLVYLSETCVKWLHKYRSSAWEKWKSEATSNSLMRRVFTNSSFLPVTRNVMYNWIAAAGRKAKLKKQVHPHLLRHTFGTKMVMDGANVVIVKEIMGHASLSTTQIYVAVTESGKQDAVKRIFNHQKSDGTAE